MERPYLTAGGDFGIKINGFRLDVENHGKTPAFITGYDMKFATLATLQQETKQGKKPRELVKNRYRNMDGISPNGARKQIFTKIFIKPGKDVIYGAVYYRDAILGKYYKTRFLLRIESSRDIPGYGLTRLDRVEDVHEAYWDWDYPRKGSNDESGG
jgi:hypothetical protein